MLSCYRAIDLTDHHYHLAGTVLADFGVRVIKVEPPEGDPGRRLEPFYKGQEDPDKSLYWLAFNRGKMGITLSLEQPEGRELFLRLVDRSNILVESFPPGYLDSLGLGYELLRRRNPGIIHTSITPFGSSGPRSNWVGADIVAAAAGGWLYLTGDPDRPPVMTGFPIFSAFAALQAVAGTMIAFHHWRNTGEGQHVDTSAQESVANILLSAPSNWELVGSSAKRVGQMWYRGGGNDASQRILWPCRNGTVAYMVMPGVGGVRSSRALLQWMEEDGMADDFIRGVEWEKLDVTRAEPSFVRQIEESLGRFFLAHDKEELHRESKKRGVLLQMVATTGDVLENPQLVDRGFWTTLYHPTLEADLTYPGQFARSSEITLYAGAPAPSLGQHNLGIYQGELGLSDGEIGELRRRRVI